MAKKLDINTKERILSVVESLLEESGANKFSLRDIAKKADISLGTLYYHYKTKNELIIDLAKLYLEQISDEYFSWLKRHKDDLTPSRFLDVIFDKGANFFNKGRIHIFLLNECIGGNEALAKQYTLLYKIWQENLKIGVKQVFPNVKDSNTFATFLMMIVDGMIFQELLKLDTNVDENKIKELLMRFTK